MWITMGKWQKFKTYIKNFYALFVFPDGHKGNCSGQKSGNHRLLFIKNAVLLALIRPIYLLVKYLHIINIINVKFYQAPTQLVFTFHFSLLVFHLTSPPIPYPPGC